MKKLSRIGIILLAITVVASFASLATSAEPTPTILDNITYGGKVQNPLGTYDSADIIVFKKGSDKIFIAIDASLQGIFEDYFSSGGSVEALRAKLADSDPSLSGQVELLYYTAGTTGSYLNPQGNVTSTFTFNGDGTFTITGESMSHFSTYSYNSTSSSEESSTPSSSEESSTPGSSEESSVPSSEESSTPGSSEESRVPSSKESSTPSSSQESSTPSSSEESSVPSSSEESSVPSSSEESSTPSSSEESSVPSSEESSTPGSSEESSTPGSSEESSVPSSIPSSEISFVISVSVPNNAGNPPGNASDPISTISIADEEVPLDVPSMGAGFVKFAPTLAVMSMLGILVIVLSKKVKA